MQRSIFLYRVATMRNQMSADGVYRDFAKATSNAVLQDISSELKENEQGLVDGQKSLQTALDKLATVESVLNTVSSLSRLSRE